MRFIFPILLFLINLQIFAQSKVDIDSLIASKAIERLIKSGKQSLNNDTIFLMSGKIFDNQIEHKYIRYIKPSGIYIRVYTKKDDYKKPLINQRMYWMNFVSDTIFDINGDSINDLAVHWYPSSGCCLADVFDCYIYEKANDKFRTKTEIINPTFFPNKFQVFSMDYNQPGETKFYELIWNNHGLDTINIYSWKDKTQKSILISNYRNGQVLESKKVPREIIKLNGIEWFMMKRD